MYVIMKKALWLAFLLIGIKAFTIQAQVTVIKAGKLIDPETSTVSASACSAPTKSA